MENTQKTKTIVPIETKRLRTSLNLKQLDVAFLSKVAASKKITQTAIMDEAIAKYRAEVMNTTDIDQMLKETNNFWFERPLQQVIQMLPIEKAKKLLPYQVAYLYFNLKDQADRERVFEALTLKEGLKEINAMNAVLQKASLYKNDVLTGYNLHIVANELRAKPTQLQEEYLNLKIGKDAFVQLQQRRPDLFPQIDGFTDDDPIINTDIEAAELFPEDELEQ